MIRKVASTSGYAVAGLAALLVMVAPAVAAAEAQPPKILVVIHDDPELPNGRLVPETGLARMNVDVFMTTPPSSACLANLNFEFEVTESPAWLDVVPVPPSVDVEHTGGPVSGTAETFDFENVTTLEARADAGSPAFVDGRFTLQVTATFGATESGCSWTPARGAAESSVKIDYVAGVEITLVEEQASRVSPWEARIPVRMTSQANGPTTLGIEVVEAPAEFNQVRFEWDPAMVATMATPGRFSELVLTAAQGTELPGDAEQVTLLLIGQFDGSAQGTLDRDPHEVTFTLEDAGVLEAVPGPGAPLLLIGLALVALLARRAPARP